MDSTVYQVGLSQLRMRSINNGPIEREMSTKTKCKKRLITKKLLLLLCKFYFIINHFQNLSKKIDMV
jgi:hypothetical protein